MDQATFVRGNILKTLIFGGEIRSRRRSMRPSLSCKVDCWMHVFSDVLVDFSSLWGQFRRAWGASGVLLVPRGAQADSGPHFFALLSTSGQLLDRFASPRGATGTPRNARRSKWCPKCSRRGPKVSPKVACGEMHEAVLFDDSIMKIIGFWCPGRSLGRPKR